MADQSELLSWLRDAVAESFPNGALVTIFQLKGDASTRRFWRVAITLKPGYREESLPSTVIAVDLGPDDLPLYARALGLVPQPLPEPPWLTLQRFLASIEVAVPKIYHADLHRRMMLVEDVGPLSLFEAAERADAADLYRLAVDQLLIIHQRGTKNLPTDALPARIAYDERLFRWELEQFLELGTKALAPGSDLTALGRDLDDLAIRLGRLPRVLSHRDYHGHNLYLQFISGGEPVVRVIDFQDALMAPAAQDLAVLLTTRDTSRIIAPRVEQRVLDYYYAALLRQDMAPMPFAEFIESYRLCVLQHALKVIGRFLYLEQQGREGYGRYIPYAISQARRILTGRSDFPALRSSLRE